MSVQEELIKELTKKENREIARLLCRIKRSKQLFLEVSNSGAYEKLIELKLKKLEENELENIEKRIKKRSF